MSPHEDSKRLRLTKQATYKNALTDYGGQGDGRAMTDSARNEKLTQYGTMFIKAQINTSEKGRAGKACLHCVRFGTTNHNVESGTIRGERFQSNVDGVTSMDRAHLLCGQVSGVGWGVRGVKVGWVGGWVGEGDSSHHEFVHLPSH